MPSPPTTIEIPRDEGLVRLTFTPGLSIDQWAQTAALRRPMSHDDLRKTAEALARDWGVEVTIDPP